MKFHDIIKGSTEYLRDAVIEVDTLHGWVTIRDKEGAYDDIFLQGHEGYDFIARADKLYNDVGTVYLYDCYAFLARSYVECIWG